jgi:heme exporter protein A
VTFQPVSLRVTDLACARGGRVIFEHVDFELAPGEWLELRGANGSGKTSLLRLLAGLNESAQGHIKLNGADEDAPRGTFMHFIGPADAAKPALTVRENLTFWGDFLGGRTACDLSHFRLEELADVPVALLSSGQRRRLALSRLLTAPRPIWLLDEPTTGLDAKAIEDLQAAIRQHLQSGGIAVVATHSDVGLQPSRQLTLVST